MKNWWTIHFHWAKSCHDILALGSEAVAQEDDLPRSGVPQGNLECILRSQVLIWIIELFGNHIIQVVTVPGNPWRKDISNIKLYFFCRMWVLRCYILNYPRIRFCLGSGLPSLPCFVIFCSLILRKQTPRNGFHGATSRVYQLTAIFEVDFLYFFTSWSPQLTSTHSQVAWLNTSMRRIWLTGELSGAKHRFSVIQGEDEPAGYAVCI